MPPLSFAISYAAHTDVQETVYTNVSRRWKLLLLKAIVGCLLNVAMYAAFLLIPASWNAGKIVYWPRAFVFLIVYGLILEWMMIVMAIRNPASLEVRFRIPFQKNQHLHDQLISLYGIVWFISWILLIPIDVFQWRLLPPPGLIVSTLGGILFLVGFLTLMTAINQNPFASPFVEDLTAEGQIVIDKGLYGFVRHPLYLGTLAFLVGLSLWLESTAATLAVLAFFPFLSVRIAIEERVLEKVLPPYASYRKRVPYRLIPWIW